MSSQTEEVKTRHGADEQPDVLSALKRFARMRAPIERCELCSSGLDSVHQHLLDRHSRQIACACDACAILFCDQQGGKYLRVPRRVRQLLDFSFSDLEWEEMMLPINLAFIYRTGEGRMSALYPSPAGAIESQVGLPSWEQQVGNHPALQAMEPEVEALIVNRVSDPSQYFIAPIDECYRLTGVIRTKWRGLSGGTELWAAISGFFLDLQQKTHKAAEVPRA
jgi:hypothetical protein